ncbi:hypothetical protein FQN50_001809 [Emmonsiellopsis sp. PD_5]|nr:hypothetical protein FQN50_001809 [Emmonsiellopsis sp. PD_5]
MAWQRPSVAARALRSAHNGFLLESQLARPSFPISYQPPLSASTSQLRSQKRSASTYSPDSKIVAAKPLNLETMKTKVMRILPASPAYFSGTPQFIDDVLKLEKVQSKFAWLPTVPAGEAPRVSFIKYAEYKNRINEPVPAAKYRKLHRLLNRLNQIEPGKVPSEVKIAMKPFIRAGDARQQALVPKVPDDMGRARGVGRRKTSTATAWLVEGDGQVLINGKNIVQVFPRVHDRESALWPLRATNRLDKYNVFAITHGGGVTGQAEALTVALGKALMIHEPAMKPTLRQAGCVSTDARQVERKKHGHLKARKKPAWVRR